MGCTGSKQLSIDTQKGKSKWKQSDIFDVLDPKSPATMRSLATEASHVTEPESPSHNQPKIGRLNRGGRRNSLTTREEPALPLSPNSKLNGTNLSSTKDFTGRRKSQCESWTSLHIAADEGNLNALKHAHEVGLVEIDARTQDESYCTALWLAAASGKCSCVRYLLSKEAAINAVDSHGETALHVACKMGRTQVVDELLDAGAEVERADEEGATPLFISVLNGEERCAERLLDNLADLKSTNNDGRGLLWAAAINGNEHVMDMLLVFRAKLNMEERDPMGCTPLYIAAGLGHVAACQSLVNKGAKLGAVAKDGTTPLWIAAFTGHSTVVKLLLAKGASLEVDTPRGKLGQVFAGGVADGVQAEVKRHCECAKQNQNQNQV